MYKEFNNDFFDILLAKALYADMELEQNNDFSESEVRELFPYTHKQEREARRLRRILKHGSERSAFIYIKRAAVILLCTVTLSFGLLMTDDGICAAVGEKVREIVEKVLPMSYKADMDDVIKEKNEEQGYYVIDFDDVKVTDRNAAEKEFSIENVEVTYIPEGFEKYESVENELIRVYKYKNNSNEKVLVRFSIEQNAEITVDADRTDEEDVCINGNDGIIFCIENEKSNVIIWGNELYVCRIYGNVSREELIKVAEGLKY